MRDADVVARWTEEDLLAVLPETDLLGAEVAAERLRDTLSDIPLHAGAVEWQGDTGDILIRRANVDAVRS